MWKVRGRDGWTETPGATTDMSGRTPCRSRSTARSPRIRRCHKKPNGTFARRRCRNRCAPLLGTWDTGQRGDGRVPTRRDLSETRSRRTSGRSPRSPRLRDHPARGPAARYRVSLRVFEPGVSIRRAIGGRSRRRASRRRRSSSPGSLVVSKCGASQAGRGTDPRTRPATPDCLRSPRTLPGARRRQPPRHGPLRVPRHGPVPRSRRPRQQPPLSRGIAARGYYARPRSPCARGARKAKPGNFCFISARRRWAAA
jgi:hypothetical protein